MLLNGVTVLEVGSGVPVAYCGRVLASLGATVIKLEQAAEPDWVRTYGAPCPEHGTACAWCHLNGAKVRVAIAPEADGARVLASLAARSAIAIAGDGSLVDAWEAGDAGALSTVRMAPSVDESLAITVAADESAGVAAGLRDPYGRPEPPAGKRMDIAEVNAGAHAAAVVTLVLARQAMGDGEPVSVRVGVYDAALSMIEIAVQTRLLADLFGDATSNIIASSLGDPLVCRDGGLIGINLYGKDVWARMCEVMEQPELAGDERFIETVSRWANAADLRAIDRWCITLDRDDAMARLRKHLIPAAPIISCSELLEQDQVIARGIITADGAHAAGAVGSPYLVDGERLPLPYITPRAALDRLAALQLEGVKFEEVPGCDYVLAELQ